MGASHNIVRVLSKLGICSRKQAVGYVQSGRVRLNGKIVRDPGAPARLTDNIVVAGKLPVKKEKIYIILNKPAGCVTTRSDELGRRTVYDYLGDMGQWLFPVGRLDLESEGLLLFTNDTELGNRLTDPRYKIPRTYNVTVDGVFSAGELDRIRRGGIAIGRGEITGPAVLSVIDEQPGSCTVRITLTEGKNRELRRMFEVFNKKVLRLLRTDFGGFKLGDIPPGQWRKCQIPASLN
ncbi:MAG: pseudouridine synthase [Elusimicrobiales bacterium]|nr:pseudouridine synthase [Elusimicrobiales bacterium]